MNMPIIVGGSCELVQNREEKGKIEMFVCLFVWILWYINTCRLFNAKIQINSSVSNNSV